MILLNLDDSELRRVAENLKGAQKKIEKAVGMLAAQAHAHIVDQAQQELHSRREKYISALQPPQEEGSAATWVIALNPEALWIEEGVGSNTEMLDKLLDSPKTKTAKDGSRYRPIPFENNKTPTTLKGMPYADQMKQAAKRFLKSQGVPFSMIEKNGDGSAKTGLLHSFEFFPERRHPKKEKDGPGQGHGFVGDARRGHFENGYTPFLYGMRVYQREVEDAAKKKSIQRSVVTFRNVSSKQDASKMWVHPGLEPKHFFEKAYDWALKEWQTNVAPQLIADLTR